MPASDHCPFCEAPQACEHHPQGPWSEPNDDDQRFAAKAATIHTSACGTFVRVNERERPVVTRSELCIARQRLFDDVLARETANLFERLQTTANLGIFSGRELRTTMDTLRNAAMSMARTIVNLRYPIPSPPEGAADARE